MKFGVCVTYSLRFAIKLRESSWKERKGRDGAKPPQAASRGCDCPYCQRLCHGWAQQKMRINTAPGPPGRRRIGWRQRAAQLGAWQELAYWPNAEAVFSALLAARCCQPAFCMRRQSRGHTWMEIGRGRRSAPHRQLAAADATKTASATGHRMLRQHRAWGLSWWLSLGGGSVAGSLSTGSRNTKD